MTNTTYYVYGIETSNSMPSVAPIAELTSLKVKVGSTKSSVTIVSQVPTTSFTGYKAVRNSDGYTIYTWDSTASPAEAVPTEVDSLYVPSEVEGEDDLEVPFVPKVPTEYFEGIIATRLSPGNYGVYQFTNTTPKNATYRLMCTDTDENRANAVATRLKLIFKDVLVTSTPQSDLTYPGPEGTLDPGHII